MMYLESQISETPSEIEMLLGGGESNWYPQRKLDIVKRKLNGGNPAGNIY